MKPRPADPVAVTAREHGVEDAADPSLSGRQILDGDRGEMYLDRLEQDEDHDRPEGRPVAGEDGRGCFD